MTALRCCTFTVGDLVLGIEAARVSEVLRTPEVTPVPLAHPSVLGLVNLRGQIVTAVGARSRFGMPDAPPGTEPVHIVMRIGDESVSLVVDREGDVIDVAADSIEEIPETVNETVRDLVVGAFQTRTALLLLLDPEAALALTAI